MRRSLKLILISLISILAQTTSQGQVYESIFGTESTQWNLFYGNLWGTATAEHKTEGDTIIDNLSYKIVGGYEGSLDFKGFLRQDSLNSKAWYRNNQGSDEILIMDLNLAVGDSMFIAGNWNSQHGYQLVDSVYVLDNRKYIRFDFNINSFDGEKFTLIEGITSNLGFRFQDNDYINNIVSAMLCSYKNGIQVYGEGECYIDGGNSVQDPEKNVSLTISPNPFSTEIKLESDLSLGNWNYMVVDILGQTIINKSSIYLRDHKIDLSQLNNGLFYLVLLDENGNVMHSSKIVKND